MIKNIIFDMGKVLIRFDPDYFINQTKITNKNDKDLLKKEIYLSLEWSMMDRGTLSEEEASQKMMDRLPQHLKQYTKTLVSGWYRELMPIPGAEELIRELKTNGYKIFLLSNASLSQKDYWINVPANECFDGVVVSSYIHLVKPQPEIYNYLLDKYNLIAEECVFIDDASFNVEGAVYTGINGLVFHNDYKEIRSKLIDLGVNISK